jgi:hypothetical protein
LSAKPLIAANGTAEPTISNVPLPAKAIPPSTTKPPRRRGPCGSAQRAIKLTSLTITAEGRKALADT